MGSDRTNSFKGITVEDIKIVRDKIYDNTKRSNRELLPLWSKRRQCMVMMNSRQLNRLVRFLHHRTGIGCEWIRFDLIATGGRHCR